MLKDLKEVKRIRSRLSLTQSELAEIAGVSQSLIAKIENGDTIPSYDKGRAILESLDTILKNRGTTLTAEDIHTEDVIYVSSHENLGAALKIMKENAVSQIPVIDDNMVVGALTERCLLNNFDNLDKNRSVKAVMEEPFPVIPSKSNTNMVKDLLRYYPSVLTTSDGKITGIITKADILEEILSDR